MNGVPGVFDLLHHRVYSDCFGIALCLRRGGVLRVLFISRTNNLHCITAIHMSRQAIEQDHEHEREMMHSSDTIESSH